ncbi:MAG: hypothetical protein IJI14_15775, partial [Anaerolineaceae bacterium]|nr:hypothetical protein [Anaerolineaceae bacterium]
IFPNFNVLCRLSTLISIQQLFLPEMTFRERNNSMIAENSAAEFIGELIIVFEDFLVERKLHIQNGQ